MTGRLVGAQAIGAAIVALLAFPFLVGPYYLGLAISLLSYAVLAVSWALFAGPTRQISLATAGFFGIGAYTAAVLGQGLPWPLVLIAAGAIGTASALAVGFFTLRFSGITFAVLTFGVSELLRRGTAWCEAYIHGPGGRQLTVELSPYATYFQLLALALLVFLTGWVVGRSRLGAALHAVGEHGEAARHGGIDAARAKLALFAVSALFMSLTGAAMALRWTSIDPAVAFDPVLSLQVAIMALLGGAGSLFGPLLAVVPLGLLFVQIAADVPYYFGILLLAVMLIAIVYFMPHGVIGLVRDRFGARPAAKEP